jgi:RHS repeat-associated protein
MSRRLIVLVLTLVAGLPLLAQQGPDGDPDAAQGYVDNVFHHSQVDSVNLYNGQLTVPIAVGPSYPIGPKLKLQLVLTYGSRVWEYGHPKVQNPDGASAVLAGDPAVGIGWTFTLGAIKTCSTGKTCYVGPDGSQHAFDIVDSRGSGYLKTSDASQLSLLDVGYPNDGPFEMWDGDGNHYVFGWHVSGFDDPLNDPLRGFTHDFGRGRDGWYLTSLTDPFGNGYSTTYRTGIGPCWTYSTSCTYQVIQCPATSMNLWIPQAITLPAAPPNNVITISVDATQMISGFTFPVSGGNSATWSLGYQGPPIPYAETCGGSLPYVYPNLRAIYAIQLPNSIGSYQFSYNNPFNCVTGLLTHMQVPTGGTVDYLYGTYSFYHGRLTALNQNCHPIGPDPSALVEVSGPPICGSAQQGQSLPTPAIGYGSCTESPNYLDLQGGVVRRTAMASGSPSVTDYVQYAFPFGEQGTPTNNCDALERCGAQNLTVAIFPPDVDGRRRAKGVLFWSAPKHPNQVGVYAGERTGADIEERVYDSDPTQNVNLAMPVCGAQANPICADRAVRVTQRTFEYDIATSDVGDRRLLQEKEYYGPTSANGTCPTCAYHQVSNSNFGSSTWEGNGRHYNIETHGGNLGGDFRQVATTWSPTISPWFPSLFDKRITSDVTGTLNQYFDYDHSAQANGFLRGSVTWDSGRSLLFVDCLYIRSSQGVVDTHGNVASRYTGTFSSWTSEPDPRSCSLLKRDPSSWGGFPGKGDIFATDFSYQNGQRVSARAVNGSLPGGWLKYDVTRDPKTGWITSSRDTAGLQTSYLYDSLGRPTSITPPGEVATTVTYDSTTQTTAVRNGGADSTTWSQFQYDGLGRTIRERRQMPGGSYAKRFTKFDARGYAYFQSEWVAEADWPVETLTANVGVDCPFSGSSYSTNVPSSAPGVYRACFDPYGRPQLLTGVGYSSQMTISRTDTRQPTVAYYSDTAEASTIACLNSTLVSTLPHCPGGSDATTTTMRDAFGRSTSVTEPGGDTTSYGYDVIGKLTSVVQGAQTRTFSYDRFGFLRTETTPEKGTVTYDSVGSLGNVRQQTEPGSLVLSRSFDYAGRFTAVSSNEGRTYVTNTYDQPSRGSSLGKLTTSVSTNFALSTPSTVTDSFWYSGTGGRLSTKTQGLSGSASLSATQTFAYNSLGLLSAHSHPRAGSDTAFTVSSTFNAGLPVSELVNGTTLVSGIVYQPSGALASYATNNSPGHTVTTTISQDGNLPRPSRIQTAGASTNFDSGVYAYDGAGNIRTVGSDTFTYDVRSRLLDAHIYDYVGVDHRETFSYDRYGNISLHTVDGAPYTFSIDATKNRLVADTQTTYDSRGNLTLYGVSKFDYDGLSRQTKFAIQSGSTDERYLYDAGAERVARVIPAPGVGGLIPSSFHALTPCRFVDTRAGSGFPSGYGPPSIPGGGTQRTFVLAGQCGIPTDAQAVSLNVAVWAPPTRGDLRVFPAGGGTPTVSTLNWEAGILSLANAAMVKLGSGGAITVMVDGSGTVDLFVDVNGYFTAPGAANELTLHTLTPCRLVDTRTGSGFTGQYGPPSIPGGGTQRTFVLAGQCGIPTDAQAVSLNVAVWAPPTRGDLRVFPAGGGTPTVSTLNWEAGILSLANAAIVKLGSSGAITVMVDGSGTIDLFVDVNGYFATAPVPVDTYYFTLKDEKNRLATKYNLAGGVATVDKDYVYLGNQLVATWQPASGYSFFMTDHLGTPRLQTDLNATTVTRAKNRAFGLPLTGALPQQGPEYASMEKDSASGNHYDHARFYTSWLGRFQVSDLIGGNPGDPQSWNRYAYARNNPLKFLDPDGRAVKLAVSQTSLDQNRSTRAAINAAANIASDASGVPGLAKVADAIAAGFFPQTQREVGEAFEASVAGMFAGVIVPGEASLLKLTSGNFRQNLMRSLGKSAEEVAGQDAHHMLPQAEKFAEQFTKAGLDVHDPKFGTFWDRATHQGVSSQFNADWTGFLSKDRSAEEIQKYARVLAVKYDISW